MNIRVLVILGPALLLLWGCGRSAQEREAVSAFTVTDDLGRAVRFDTVPRRIVSLAPSLTEALFAVGAGDLVVGVTRSCNYPAAVRDLPVVGDLLNPDVERVLALQPDLVLISVEGNTQKSFAAMERVGLRLFVSNPRTLEGVRSSLLDLGRITGRAARADRVADSLGRIAHALRAALPAEPPSVLMLISAQPLMAAGGNTFLDEIITLAGGRNAAADAPGNYPTLNRESVLRMDPDIIAYPDDMQVRRADLVDRFPEWAHVTALRANRIYALDADIFLRPGPRAYLAAQRMHALIREAASGAP